MDPNTSLASLLSGIFSGAYGLNQLVGSGKDTAAGSAAAGAAAASPFQSQFGNYQPQVQGAINNAQGSQGALSSIISGINTSGAQGQLGALAAQAGGLNGAITGNQSLTSILSGLATQGAGGVSSAISGSGQSLQDQVAALSTNYMNNPAIQAQYNLGLDTVNRGLLATGYGGSGQQQAQLEEFGQQFASNAYQQQLQDILSTNQQAFGQNVGATQLGAGLQQQQFGEALQGTQLAGQFQQNTFANQLQSILSQGNLVQSGSQLGLSGQGLQIQGFSTLGNEQQGLLNALGLFSGASTGSPATAGSILSGQFGNAQTAAGNLGAGITGIASGIDSASGGSLSSGLGNFLGNLFGGGDIGTSIGDILSGTIGGGALGGGFSSLGGDLLGLGTSGVEGDLGVGLGALGGLF